MTIKKELLNEIKNRFILQEKADLFDDRHNKITKKNKAINIMEEILKDEANKD